MKATAQNPLPTAASRLIGLHLAVYRAALHKLNECRAKCPGIGGDVCAMNLRALIEREHVDTRAADQARHTLQWMSGALRVDARHEIAALEALPDVVHVLTLLRSF